MNFNSYGSYYGIFHQCPVSHITQNIIVFNFGMSPYETWLVTRMFPPDTILIDSEKPLILALKTFFKSDEIASVVCNDKFLWTVFLGSEHVIFPIGKSIEREKSLRFYATPYYVTDLNIINQYLKGTIRPAYETVFFYKNTVLFLDNEDLPYPGGNYFKKCDPVSKYRLCFLSDEPMDYVLNLASEWQFRQGVSTILYMTREIAVDPKFIDFKPVSEMHLMDAHISSTGTFQKTLSSKKPEHLIQDILNGYYGTQRALYKATDTLGLLIEWPLYLTYEGARPVQDENRNQYVKQFVALSVNGPYPDRVLVVYQPYERYLEYTNVPATLWTPISFTLSTFITDASIRKVAIDTVVIGVVYRETFFCFSQPLLEGNPVKKPLLNSRYIVSTAKFEPSEDVNVQVIDSFRLTDRYALRRVTMKGLPSQHGWCLTESSKSIPYPKNIQLPYLVKWWTDFFLQVGDNSFDVDVSGVRLALMLAKHNLCFNLNVAKKSKDVLTLNDNDINFNLDEEVVQFINDVRLIKIESKDCSSKCTIS